VEFHPAYHVLMARALHHGLHGTPWSGGPGGPVRRAAGLMVFTELEPSVLCPVTMTYAVTPALRANPALHVDWSGPLACTAYDARPLPGAHKTSVTLGMGMTEKQGSSDVRANTTRTEYDSDTPWGPLYHLDAVLRRAAPVCT
jgi:putative acyl-CoA dehydrogenase